MNEYELRKIVKDVIHQYGFSKSKNSFAAHAGVSARHIHISENDLEILFGKNYSLTKFKGLVQPGQFACEEKVCIATEKNIIPNVRILGPIRKRTQVEISKTDAFFLGLNAPIRDSGDLLGSAPITIIGPKSSIYLSEGVIIAARHLHISDIEADRYKLKDKDKVKVICSGERPVIFSNVLVRAGKAHKLEFHIDVDEANAANLKSGDKVIIEH